MNAMQRSRGFTLIELMVVAIVIGILGAVAFPNYVSYLVNSRRAVAQGDLLSAASAMERHFTATGAYTGAAAGTTFPTNSPSDGGTAHYTLSFPVAVTATTFTIRATPVAGSRQARDGFLQINHQGIKSWDQNANGAIDAGENTWKK